MRATSLHIRFLPLAYFFCWARPSSVPVLYQGGGGGVDLVSQSRLSNQGTLAHQFSVFARIESLNKVDHLIDCSVSFPKKRRFQQRIFVMLECFPPGVGVAVLEGER